MPNATRRSARKVPPRAPDGHRMIRAPRPVVIAKATAVTHSKTQLSGLTRPATSTPSKRHISVAATARAIRSQGVSSAIAPPADTPIDERAAQQKGAGAADEAADDRSE